MKKFVAVVLLLLACVVAADAACGGMASRRAARIQGRAMARGAGACASGSCGTGRQAFVVFAQPADVQMTRTVIVERQSFQQFQAAGGRANGQCGVSRGRR